MPSASFFAVLVDGADGGVGAAGHTATCQQWS